MKRITIAVLALILIAPVVLAVTPPTEDLMKIGVGARPMGMGKAFVALADDGNAVFLNPAGLAQLNTWQVTSMYSSILSGKVPYMLLSGSSPVGMGQLALGFISTGISAIPSPTSTGISYFDYFDRLYFVSYAMDGKKIGRENLLLGANLKIFTKGFSGSVTDTGTGFDLDLGAKYNLNSKLSFGANLQNILPTTVHWTTGADDDIPMVLKVGTAVRPNQDFTLALDLDVPFKPGFILAHLGAEWPVNPILVLRAGLDQISSADANITTNATAGVGLLYKGFSLNYAYHPYLDSPSNLAHFFSISFSPVK